jgi:hypothetical protein
MREELGTEPKAPRPMVERILKRSRVTMHKRDSKVTFVRIAITAFPHLLFRKVGVKCRGAGPRVGLGFFGLVDILNHTLMV